MSGVCSAAAIAFLESFLNRCKRLGYCEQSLPSVTECNAEDALFERIMTNSAHVLQQYLPDRPDTNYSFRERSHNKTLRLLTYRSETLLLQCCISIVIKLIDYLDTDRVT